MFFKILGKKNEDVLENECFRDLTISSDLSNKALASKINVTKRTIQRSIGILEKQGYIEKTTFCNSKVITLNPNIDYHSLLNPSSNFFPMYDGFKINVCATLNEVKLNGNITDEKISKKLNIGLKSVQTSIKTLKDNNVIEAKLTFDGYRKFRKIRLKEGIYSLRRMV